VNRAERRAAARNPHVRRIAAVEDHRIDLAEQLRQQALEIQRTTPGPGETTAEALAALEAFIAGMAGHELLAGPALAVLRAHRDDLTRSLEQPN
jgi:hypothetical protein